MESAVTSVGRKPTYDRYLCRKQAHDSFQREITRFSPWGIGKCPNAHPKARQPALVTFA